MLLEQTVAEATLLGAMVEVAVSVTTAVGNGREESAPPLPCVPPPPAPAPPVSHIFGDIGASRSGEEVEVSATDSPSLLHLESIFRRFSFRS